MSRSGSEKSTLAVGGLAAVLASACCLGPLILVSVGLSGAWIGQLTRLEPFRPWFLVVSLIALVFAYRRIYWSVAACQPGEVCAVPAVRQAYKVMFWIVVALVLIALAFPYVAPWFYWGISYENDAKTQPATLTQATADAGYPSTTQH